MPLQQTTPSAISRVVNNGSQSTVRLRCLNCARFSPRLAVQALCQHCKDVCSSPSRCQTLYPKKITISSCAIHAFNQMQAPVASCQASAYTQQKPWYLLTSITLLFPTTLVSTLYRALSQLHCQIRFCLDGLRDVLNTALSPEVSVCLHHPPVLLLRIRLPKSWTATISCRCRCRTIPGSMLSWHRVCGQVVPVTAKVDDFGGACSLQR